MPSLALQLSSKIFILDERNLLADFITKAEQLSRIISTCHCDPESICLFCGPPSPTIRPPLMTKLRAVHLLPSSELLCLDFQAQKGMSWVTHPRSVVWLVICDFIWWHIKSPPILSISLVQRQWALFKRSCPFTLELFQQPHVHN